MEAKDTVVSSEQKLKVSDKILTELGNKLSCTSGWKLDNLYATALLQAQAEISFKAGQQSRQDEIDLLHTIVADKDVAIIDLKSLLELGKQAGIREVVEWIKSPEALEVGRKAVEDTLIEWRDSRLSEPLRGNGLVVREKGGTDSSIIRFGPETALRIGNKAILKAKLKEWRND